MEADPYQWLSWAAENNIDDKVCQFISTYPEYLVRANEDDIDATPRSYERISALYRRYIKQQNVRRSVFYNVVRGNVGKVIAEEFLNFIESDYTPLITYEDVFTGPSLSDDIRERVAAETHTRLYISARNILNRLSKALQEKTLDGQFAVSRFVTFLQTYPVDLAVAVMKDIRNTMPAIYEYAQYNDDFIDMYFAPFRRRR